MKFIKLSWAKKLFFLVFVFTWVTSCQGQKPTSFSESALKDTFLTLQGESVPFKNILEKNKGKTLLIAVWASWCSDCIKGMPKLKELQESKQEIAYVFLSLDKSSQAWKKGIEKYQIQGDHYYMQSGWKGAFGKFLKLNSIPRYMVVDENGNITNFKETKVNKKLNNSLP